ncbi:putative leucine-rich repeat-containing protein DDB_G0290503 [Mercenaria mercenaria]|uniref:putative leucine-rich repeat-containing protein DDB_G0290503 n=1 Tax=Mercenaria mercenaria TaxID=6596 RepID=UPI00234F8619|nr:putative leucine-rich repeat-containing protein DDB_G0290503 [Mercenaria mercenaria]
MECKGTFQKILCLHKEQINNLKSNPNNPDFKDIRWDNSNDTRNLSLEWAIAKIFMPRGNEQNKGLEDTDPSAMFSLMAKCDLFTHPIKGTNLSHLIDARNNLFHSSDNLVSDVVVEDYFRLMKNLLVDASCDPETGSSIRNRICEDIKKIEKLKDSEMTMTLFEDAKKAIRIARKAIYYDFEERLCNNDPDQLRELLKLAVKLGSDLQFLNDHFDELKHQNEEIKELQKASDEKQNQIINLQMHIDEKQNAMKIMQEQIDEKNLKISEMEKDLDDQVAENVKLSKESDDDKEEIRSMQYKISDHLEEIDNLRKQYDEKLTEIKDNCNKFKHLNNLCAGQHSKIEQLRNANDELKTQNAEKEGKIAGLLKQIGDHEDEIKSLHQKNESSRFEIEELRIDKEEQTNKNAMLQKERDFQSLEIKELQDENKYHYSETEKLREEKDNMLYKISALRKKGDDQQLEIKQLHEQIESQRHKITEQLCENHNLREQNEEKTGEINKVLKENHEFLQEIKELHRNITSSCAQVDEQQKQICDLKSQEMRSQMKFMICKS